MLRLSTLIIFSFLYKSLSILQRIQATYLFSKNFDEHNIGQSVGCSKKESIQEDKDDHSNKLMESW